MNRVRKSKVERVRIGLKQIELARLTGIDRGRLNMFENGWLSLRPEEVERIKEVLSEAKE